MSAATPLLEGLVSWGTLYQFFLARSPVDALERVSQQLKNKNQTSANEQGLEQRRIAVWWDFRPRTSAWWHGRRGPAARCRTWWGSTAPASRDLVEEFRRQYDQGIADGPLEPVQSRSFSKLSTRHATRHAVLFPDMQQVFHSDREALGWITLCVATTGIFIDDICSNDPLSCASIVSTILLLVGFVAMYFWDRSVQKILVATYKAEIEKLGGGGNGATAASPTAVRSSERKREDGKTS